MMASTTAARQVAHSQHRSLELRQVSESSLERRFYVLAHQRHHCKDGQHSVNHAGHRRQQFHQESAGRRQPGRRQLSQENRRTHAQGDGDYQRHDRRHHRSIDERQGSEIVRVRIPVGAPQKTQTELMARRGGSAQRFQTSRTVMRTTVTPKARVTRRAVSSPIAPDRRRDGTEAVAVTAISVNLRDLL